MLTRTDFLEKQILIVKGEFGERTFLRIQNSNVSFYKNGKCENKLPSCKIFCIFILGDLAVTSYLIKDLIKNGVSIFFMRYNFETYASFNSFSAGNYLLRSEQYSQSIVDDLKIAKKIVKNKIHNQLLLLKHHAKKDIHIQNELKNLNQRLDKVLTLKELLGIEGVYTKNFFQEYFNSFGIKWIKRAPRSKYDEYNLLLDMGYTFLFNFIDALLSLYGFDVYKGVYHQLFFQRKSLVCDIMEPFRCIIEKQVAKSFNLNQIDKDDFSIKNGRYALKLDKTQKYAKIFMEGILSYKEDIFLYVRDYYRHIITKKEKPMPKFLLRFK